MSKINLKKEPEKFYKLKGTFGYEPASNSFVFKFFDKDKKEEIKLLIPYQDEIHMQMFLVCKKQSHDKYPIATPNFTSHYRLGNDGLYKISLFRLWKELKYANGYIGDVTKYDFELIWRSQTSALYSDPIALMLFYTNKNHQGIRFLANLNAASNYFKHCGLYFLTNIGDKFFTFFDFLNWAQKPENFTVKTITEQAYRKELKEGKWLWC